MAEKKSRSRHARPPGSSNLVRIIVTGVVLGLLILGIGALTNTQTQAPVPSPLPAVPVSTVATAPASVTTSSPSAVVTTSSASNTGTGTSDPGVSATLAADAWSKPVASLASLLPRTVAGYTMEAVERSSASAIVSMEPEFTGPAAGKASIVVLTVLDKKTAAAAQTYVDQFQRAYPKDLSAVTIGTLTGRFGTDGAHLAAATFCRGRYAFEVVLTATRAAPLDLQPFVLQAAEAFGATKTAP